MQGDGHQLHASQDLSVTLIESTQSVTDQPQSKAVLLAIKALQDEVNRLEREMNEGRQREMKLAERLACVEAYWTEKLEQELIKNDGQSRELRRLEDYNRQLMAITDQLKTEKSSIQRDLTIKLESVTSENKELKAVIGQLTDKLAHAEKQTIADLKSHRQFKDKMQKEHQSEVDDLRKTLLMATEQLATTKQIVERQAKDQRLALDSLNKKIEKKENSFLKEIEALKLQIFELTNESNSTISSLKSKSKKDKEKINQLKLQLKGLLVSNSQEKESLVQELESAQATMIKTNKSVQRYSP